MDALLTVIGVVFLFGVLVFFHELGHFFVAKMLKLKVEEFAFGFGPRKFVITKRGDTEYTVRPIPLGGFVKIMGMDPTDTDTPGSFTSQPWWKRFMVYLAGPTMSILLAYVIFFLLGSVYGVPVTENKVHSVMPNSIAEKVGIKAGDRIVKIDKEPTETGEEIMQIISESSGKTIMLTIDRNGEQVVIPAVPQVQGTEKRAMLGFQMSVEIRRVGFKESIVTNTLMTKRMVVMMIEGIFSRDVTKNVGGPIAIIAATNQSIKEGVDYYIWLMGALSLSLGVINLLPIPVVDGGQMLLLTVEGIRRKRLSPKTWEIAQQVGLAMLAFIFISVMYLDVSRWISGTLIPK